MSTRRPSNNSSKRTGGRKRSTNEQFNHEVQQRIWGNTAGVKGMSPNKGNLPRVAASGANNTPAEIVRIANQNGGRNALPTDVNGTGNAHDYRYRELRSAFGMSAG